MRPTPEQLRRFRELRERRDLVLKRLEILNEEFWPLKDLIEDYLEDFGTANQTEIDGFSVIATPGEPVVAWEKAYRARCSEEAAEREIATAPRPTELTVLELGNGSLPIRNDDASRSGTSGAESRVGEAASV